MRFFRPAYFVSIFLAVFFIPETEAFAQTEVGYTDVMREVFSPYCLQCHSSSRNLGSRNGAPSQVDFNLYSLVFLNAGLGNSLVQEDIMPPAAANLTVPANSKALFQNWIDNGKPVGKVVVYQDLNKLVMEPECIRCHDYYKTEDERNGAPENIFFNFYADIKNNTTLVLKSNYHIQQGTMPPPSSDPLSDEQKKIFQDWLWLDCPSGKYVNYLSLKGGILSSCRCLGCHSSTSANRLYAPEGVDFDTYEATVENVHLTLKKFHYTSGGGYHGVFYKSDMIMLLNWVYAGMPEGDSTSGLKCDINGSMDVNVIDVFTLILNGKRNEYVEKYDLNNDRRLNIFDVMKLLTAIRAGHCVEYSMLLAADEAAACIHGPQRNKFLPETFSLAQNSPNPFNTVTTISYTVPEGDSVRVRIEVFDTGERLVATLVDQVKSAGNYSVFWDGTKSSGVKVAGSEYSCRITAGSYTSTRKMVLLK